MSYTVVTADGDVVRATADEHPDLFWGLRGGGGNFGIVVEFEFRLHPVGTRTLVADLTFPLDRAAEALRGWRDLADEAPRQATLTAEIAGDSVTLGYVWVGDPEAGRALLPALRSIGRPADEAVQRAVLPDAADPRRHHRGPRVPPLLEGPLPARPARRRDRPRCWTATRRTPRCPA